MEQPTASGHEPTIPNTTSRSSAKAPRGLNPWLTGLVGLAVGLVAGLAIGVMPQTATTAESSERLITGAVEECGLSEAVGVTVMDEGRSVTLQTEGKETYGAAYDEVVCVLDGLDMPESVKSRMTSTRSLDGMQEGTWPGYAATWNYHPDDGLHIIVEGEEQP